MNSIIITEGQSLVDVALQAGGDLSCLFTLADANGLSITDSMAPGQVLEVPTSTLVRPEVVSYYAARNYRVNTGEVANTVQATPGDYANTDYKSADYQTN